MELWLKDESDAPDSRTYGLNYHTGCMEQPRMRRLEERVKQMYSDLDTEAGKLLAHARNALKAEEARNWEASFQEYTNFQKLLWVGNDEYASPHAFHGTNGNYLTVQAWAAIPLALYHQIKLGDYEVAAKIFGTLRASRDDEISERLPMMAYASIQQHIRIIDWETSYAFKGRGQVELAQILADRAIRAFRPRWYLHPEIAAEATLCHLLSNQHRRFGQYHEAMKWRSELRKWVDSNKLSLDAEVEIALTDAYLLCDMGDFSAASRKLLELKQRISDADLDSVHLRRVLHVDNAWLQCRRHLALQGSHQDSFWQRYIWMDYEKAANAICSLTYTKSNGAEFIKFLEEVPKSVSCTDDFAFSLRMVETMIRVTSKVSSNSTSGCNLQDNTGTTDLYFDIPTGQAKVDDAFLDTMHARVHTRYNGLGFIPYVRVPVQGDFGAELENSGIQLEKLRQSATLAYIAESHNCWSLAYGQYRDVLEALVMRCDLPPPDSCLRHAYQTLFIWAALSHALTYHTQFKDFEHSIWLLRTIQLVMEASVPGPWIGGFVRGFSRSAYLAVELQMRMAAWEWSCALREDEMLDEAESLSEVATRNFPNEFHLTERDSPLDDQKRAKASLCRALANLYYDLGAVQESLDWAADSASYALLVYAEDEPPTHLRTVAGRVIRANPDTPAFPRITHVPTCVKHDNPPPRSSGSLTPERIFNADPNNSFVRQSGQNK